MWIMWAKLGMNEIISKSAKAHSLFWAFASFVIRLTRGSESGYSYAAVKSILKTLTVTVRGVNDASRAQVQLSSSRVVNISSRARTRIELTRVEF